MEEGTPSLGRGLCEPLLYICQPYRASQEESRKGAVLGRGGGQAGRTFQRGEWSDTGLSPKGQMLQGERRGPQQESLRSQRNLRAEAGPDMEMEETEGHRQVAAVTEPESEVEG